MFTFFRNGLQRVSKLKQGCQNFFMEFVAQVAYLTVDSNPPDKEFVLELVRIILDVVNDNFAEQKYAVLLNDSRSSMDTIPVLASFLMQIVMHLRLASVEH